jgi:putative two-component system response regulator
LIIDDEPGLAENLCHLLRPDFDAEPALTAEEAFDRIESGERFAVVLSDLQLPGMDGATLLGRIQELAPETTRMLFTGLYDMEVASRALSEGRIFRFLAKPCAVEELARVLEEGILRHRRKATRRLAQERLRFAHESMQGFNHLLEERLDQAQYAVVLALAKLAEERDNCTGRHLERVSAFCRELASGLIDGGHYADELDGRFIRDIERSAPLHDIGKVGIPDAILMKPGRLSDHEWEVMRTHPAIGAQTLDAIILANPGTSFLRMGRDVALAHHEYWDGNGYPAGLAGESIPLAARILKVADCYDALTTARPYKEAWCHEEAIEHILARGGTEFDPLVVDTLARVEGAVSRLREELADSRLAA